MKILHINSYFFSNSLHFQLVKKLSEENVEQIVYIPLNVNDKSVLKGSCDNVEFHVSKCFSTLSRYIWPLKILMIYRDLNKKIQDLNVDVIHAHSLFVNGSIAYLLSKKHKIDFVVTVRNSDINQFMKASKLFRKLGFKIMMSSKKILTLSYSYFNVHLKRYYNEDDFNDIKSKHEVIPNGAEDVWFDNKHLKTKIDGQLRIIFVGLLADNKNLDTVIKACDVLKSQGKDIHLSIIGSGRRSEYFQSLHYNFDVEFLGYITDRKELMKIYQTTHLLCVPSFTESFGLVYVEAMTQSLPVIYTKGQGFDGFFDDGLYGFAVDPKDEKDIANRINDICQNYESMATNAYKYSDFFRWDKPVTNLLKSYENGR